VSATNGATTANYQSDPLGRRISKTVNGVTTNFVYDGEQAIAEYDNAGTLQRKYIYSLGIDEPIAMIAGANTYFYDRDGLGSISELTDNTGAVVESYKYSAFGQPVIKDGTGNTLTQSAIGNTIMFTGRNFDAETGLYFYRARMYSSDLGRFLQTDPAGYMAGANLYPYCNSNPTSRIDPYGLSYIDVNFTGTPAGTLVGAVVGGLLTGGNPLGVFGGAVVGSLGATIGVMFDPETKNAYIYVGPAIMPSAGPTAGFSAAVSADEASAGWGAGASAVSGVAVQGGYNWSNKGVDRFLEGGVGTPRGVSASVYKTFGPINLPDSIANALMNTYKKMKGDKCAK
jgi:RHS repeat-associated protein